MACTSAKKEDTGSKKKTEEAVLAAKNLYAENLLLKMMLVSYDSTLRKDQDLMTPSFINISDKAGLFYSKELSDYQEANFTPVLTGVSMTPMVKVHNCLRALKRGGRNMGELNNILQQCSAN